MGFTLLLGMALAAHAGGTVLPVMPSVPPGRVASLPDDPLDEARRRYQQADSNGTVAVLAPYVADRASWSERTSSRLLLGRAYLELGHANLASYQFYKVRVTEGAPARVAAWYEAVADLERGRPHATIRECKEYRKRWPTGHRSDECLVLIGDAYAAQGQATSAKMAYAEYLNNPRRSKQKREEEMKLRTALALEKVQPTQSIPLFQHLTTHHVFATTGIGAINALGRLRDAGHADAIVPTDRDSRLSMAVSLRRSGWMDAAWSHFERLEQEAEDDPVIAEWVENHRPAFVRYTRHPIPGTLRAVTEYHKEGGATGERAWQIFAGWRNAGRWDQAAKWGRIGLDKHSKDRWWRGRLDDVAHAEMLAGEWDPAQKHWNAAVKARHGSRADARFYRALSTLLAGDAERAEAGFTTVIEHGGPWRAPAHYWRAKARAQSGNNVGADNDVSKASSLDLTGWYALLSMGSAPEGEGWLVRDGSWRGEEPPQLPQWKRPRSTATAQVGIWPTQIPVLQRADGSRAGLYAPSMSDGWRSLRWPMSTTMTPDESDEPGELVTVGEIIPHGYEASAHHDPKRALAILRSLGKAHADTWPELSGAATLAAAGLYDESGPIVHDAYSEYRRPAGIDDLDRRAAVDKLTIRDGAWAAASRAAHDHHFAARHVWGKKADTESEALDRLRFPVAYARELWPHSARWDLDPYLVLAVMRQESIYNPNAVSPTGAIGLMQFIKGTGAKVSALLDEPLFSPHTLFNPSNNLRYAVYYLRLLNDRFGGNFPVAVAAYNGGPHKMSQAHRSTLGELDLDAFVEMIPREEPRQYVKKVMGYYQQYVTLYGPEGAQVVLPERLSVDDAAIVDF